jgi:transposase
MSLKSLPIPPVPEEIARVARAVFPHGNVFIQLRDTLGTIYTDEAFADLFPTHGQPAEVPWRLALITIFQFMEHLTDRQAADAVRDRLAWKYALSLELTDVGFDHTVLSEFRARLVDGNAEQRLLDLFLEQCRKGGWRNRTWAATHRLDSCVSQDSCAQSHAMRSPNHGLCIECARPRSHLIGFVLLCPSNGSSAMANDWSMNVCPRKRKNASGTPIKLVPMAGCCLPR